MYILYRALLTLVHVLYEFARRTRLLWHNLRRPRRPDRDVRQSAYIFHVVRQLEKVPNHIALIFGCEQPSSADLMLIIFWCIVSGIPHITLYDKKGVLKKQEEQLKGQFLKYKPEFEEYIEWNPEPSMKTMKNGTNGIKYKTRIQCLSYEDGKGKISALTRDLAEAVKKYTIELEEITMELLESKLNPEKVPEPDLGLICGETISTYGFLPWHTRVTEFYSIPTHRNIAVKDFVKVLIEYSRCEQRYGK